MDNIISSNIVGLTDVAPWYYLTQSLLDIIIGVTLFSIIALSIFMLINKLKDKKVSKVMIAFLIINCIIFFITYMTPITENIFIDIFKVIYGY